MEFLRCKGVYQRVTRALEMRRYRKLYSLSSLRCEELPRPNKIADCSYLSATCPVGGLEATMGIASQLGSSEATDVVQTRICER